MERPALAAGSQVEVVTSEGLHLGWAFYHPKNAIALRMISFCDHPMDEAAWRSRINDSLTLRLRSMPADRANYRLIHGENDGFPGLTVDLYGKLLCMQVSCCGFEDMKSDLALWLMEATGAVAVFEQSESHARKQEGLPPTRGFLAGSMNFPLEIQEAGFKFLIDPSQDQKTGFYLDQYPARQWVGQNAKGLGVLDLCCYSGGFTLAALRGGADRVVSLDSSARALASLSTALQCNDLTGDRQESIQADLFDYLKLPADESFDLVILDPPPLAKSLRAEERARKAYRKLTSQVSRHVKPGGLLLTFSCTGIISSDVFQRSIFLGLRDANREGRVLARFGPGHDHPENLCFPEGAYLKGLLLFLS